MTRLIIFLAALGFAAPGWAQSDEAQKAVAAVFSDVCMANRENAFATYDDALPGLGYRKDGIYWVNDQKDTFQLLRHEGFVYCTFFYVRPTSDVSDWTMRVVARIYSPALNRWSTNFRNNRYYDEIGYYEPGPFEHTVVREQDGMTIYRIMVGVREQ